MASRSASGRTVPPHTGGITGFRRLKTWPKAAVPSDLEAALLTHAARETAPIFLSQQQALAFAELTKLSGLMRWLEIPRWRCTDELAFILALDQTDPMQRLRIAICRAFHRADQWAGAYAQHLDDLAAAPHHRRALEKALIPLHHAEGYLWQKNHNRQHLFSESPIAQALDIVARRRRLGEKPEDAIERYESVVHGLSVVEEVIDTLSSMEIQSVIRGRTPDDARFFFVLRLVEFFALSTGQCPDFSDEYRKTKPHWNTFIRAALTLTGLGVQGLDALLRRLGGVGNLDIGYRKHEPFYGDRLKDLSQTFVKGGFLEQFPHRDAHHGDLTSTGWLIDFSLFDEPST